MLSLPQPFVVPSELEATAPPESRGIPRDHIQLLLTDRRPQETTHAMFVDLPSYLHAGDLLVVNDSATIPAALQGTRRDGSPVPVHLSSRISGTLWIAEPRGHVQPTEVVALPNGATATFLAPVHEHSPRLWYLRLDVRDPVDEYLATSGRPIRYRYVDRDYPIAAYQTMFARRPGSVEMPSAARPFTQPVVAALSRRGIDFVSITLHCGVSSAERHEPPGAEWFEVSAAAAKRLNAARAARRRIIAVGTSVVRALESAANSGGDLIASRGWTELIVTPERGVIVPDGLLTGLHEPEATHLQLLEAFLPRETIHRAYADAIAHRYLWHEFGDVHLIL